jgi:hypothetical protein
MVHSFIVNFEGDLDGIYIHESTSSFIGNALGIQRGKGSESPGPILGKP